MKRLIPASIAAATLLLFVGRPVLIDAWRVLMPTVEMPVGGLTDTVDNSDHWTGTVKPVSMPSDARWASKTQAVTER